MIFNQKNELNKQMSIYKILQICESINDLMHQLEEPRNSQLLSDYHLTIKNQITSLNFLLRDSLVKTYTKCRCGRLYEGEHSGYCCNKETGVTENEFMIASRQEELKNK
jgi:hypothetical protein